MQGTVAGAVHLEHRSLDVEDRFHGGVLVDDQRPPQERLGSRLDDVPRVDLQLARQVRGTSEVGLLEPADLPGSEDRGAEAVVEHDVRAEPAPADHHEHQRTPLRHHPRHVLDGEDEAVLDDLVVPARGVEESHRLARGASLEAKAEVAVADSRHLQVDPGKRPHLARKELRLGRTGTAVGAGRRSRPAGRGEGAKELRALEPPDDRTRVAESQVDPLGLERQVEARRPRPDRQQDRDAHRRDHQPPGGRCPRPGHGAPSPQMVTVSSSLSSSNR